ncbi:heavy metal translocating P-type ATPase [Aminipila butyrica]|uniref:Cd(2+)-exporting ATPase n=1 Tax=Aminipila butyrica TaxID=433296 RepID=A0A858BPX1_9FIRM|nr:heavy metal translocating P-type ATPase [Aminipila butyrica]QIB67843.1 heavy metal translocating P-type ATPase [Aminipila butyrica]
MKKVYTIENIDCANCAAKIERLIGGMPEVGEATITFATKQLRVEAENPDDLVPEMTRLANTVENGVVIKERSRKTTGRRALKPAADNQSKEHEEACGCGQDHGHDHDHSDHDHDHDHEEHHHEHEEACGCGHDHGHDHDHSDHDHDHDHEEHHHEHEEACGCGHDHGHDHDHSNHNHEHDFEKQNPGQIQADSLQKELKQKKSFSLKGDLPQIVVGAVLFAVGLVLEHNEMALGWWLGCFIVAYLTLGSGVLLKAIKNIGKGQVFDENFLMSVATLGAFAIQEYPEAVGVMLFFRIGEFFEEKAVERSRSQIMEAVDLRPEVVSLVEGQRITEIAAEEAEIGDILLVKPGDRIPLDAVVIEGESRIDTSPITGEPVPVKVTPNSQVVSGCINTSGVLKIRVEKVLEDSMVTRILDSVENAAASKPKIDRFITRFARVYTPFVVAAAVLTAVIPSLVTGDWQHWIYTALTFLVISCPCALVLSVPLAFFSGIGAGSRQGILFKGGVALESLKNIKAVVMDKTGTLTKGEFVVQNIISTGNLIAYMTSGVTTGGRSISNGKDLSQVEQSMAARPAGVSKQDVETYLLTLAASCEASSTHPIGVSIVSEAKKAGLTLQTPKSIEEIAGKGIRATLQEGTVLCGNRSLLQDGNVDLADYHNPTTGSEVLLALNGQFIGALTVGDTIKPEAPSAIAKLSKWGIATAMLTGDGEESARSVAKTTGISQVFAKLLPEDKLRILQEIRKEKGSVLFIGDGINDAPVLAGADVGAAMGSGADAAIEAADVVFMTSSVEAIPQAISIAKSASSVAIQNVVFALAIKALVMVLGLVGLASMWLAVFADTGVAILCVLNSVRILYKYR